LTVTHAALPAVPAGLIHDRSRTVFPLPGGADTTVTRADAPSRSNSLGRETIPPAPGPATPPATAADPAADPMGPIIAPRQPTWPRYRTWGMLTGPCARNCQGGDRGRVRAAGARARVWPGRRGRHHRPGRPGPAHLLHPLSHQGGRAVRGLQPAH